MTTAATKQLAALLAAYLSIFPKWTFPYLPLGVAAIFQSFAWMSGPIFLNSLTLIPRILVLWLLAFGEYTFMSPTMNAGVEVIGWEEPFLVVIYQVMTLVVFMFINIFIFQKPFHVKYLISFILLSLAVFVAYM
jgi:uncharacterized protein (DUF486 family)